jgi:hypothetical protein
MTPRVVGIGVGLLLGIVWVWLSFGAVVLAGVLALIGWFVGSLIEGTIQFTDVWSVFQGRGRSLD